MVAFVGITGATLLAAPAQALSGIGLNFDGTLTEVDETTTFTPAAEINIGNISGPLFEGVTDATVKEIELMLGEDGFYTSPAVDAFKVYETADGGRIEFDLDGISFQRTTNALGGIQYQVAPVSSYEGTYSIYDADGKLTGTAFGVGDFNFSQSGASTNATAQISQTAGDATVIPEPMTILGSLAALGFGVAAKRKNDQV